MFVAFAGAVLAGSLSGLQPAPLDANQLAIPRQSAAHTLCPGLNKPVAFSTPSAGPGLVRAGYLENRRQPKALTGDSIRVTISCFDIETDEILQMQADAFNRQLGIDRY
jgi:hypothetical protein